MQLSIIKYTNVYAHMHRTSCIYIKPSYYMCAFTNIGRYYNKVANLKCYVYIQIASYISTFEDILSYYYKKYKILSNHNLQNETKQFEIH